MRVSRVAVAAVVVAGLAACGSSSKKTNAAPSPTSSLGGKYQITTVVQSNSNPKLDTAVVGSRQTSTWTIAKACSGNPCQLDITANGAPTHRTGTLAGSVLTIASTTTSKSQCKNATGQLVAGTSAMFTQVSKYTLNVQQDGALLTGIRVVDVSQKTTGSCIQQPPARLTFTASLKRASS